MSLRAKVVYAGRHFTPSWKYLFNLGSTLSYLIDRREKLSGEGARIVGELDRRGVAVSGIDALPEIEGTYIELRDEVERVERGMEKQISESRLGAGAGGIGDKSFLLRLLGDNPRLDPAGVYGRMALHPAILSIANEYFGMYTQLRYYNIWHTMTTTAPARESQLWHYDREDHWILKVFIYLRDVDEGAGPFTYAPGTHRKGKVRREPSSFDESGVRRWTDAQMAEVVPESEWVRATGGAGTILFADTRGFHKGGLARKSDRLLFTSLYTSPTSQAPELFIRPAGIPDNLGKAQRLALSPPARGLFA